jgi:hypothetical protein
VRNSINIKRVLDRIFLRLDGHIPACKWEKERKCGIKRRKKRIRKQKKEEKNKNVVVGVAQTWES